MLSPLCAVALLAPQAGTAAEPYEWTCDVSLYFLTLGVSGDLGIGRVTADVNAHVDDIVDNLEFGAMGAVRVGYGPWALTTELLYMGLQSTTEDVTVELDQWLVEPTLSYRVSQYVEPLVGVRYNYLWGEVRGPALLPTPHSPSGSEDWWDPIVGANLGLPLGKNFSLNLRGDIGGFGVGSDLTWQVFPYVGWRFTQWGSLYLGYRWVYMDYADGSGADRFAYDMLNEGLQLGFTLHF